MIAKRIPARTNGRGFGGLARYIVDASGRAEPATWTRTADYILDTAHGGAKVSGVSVTNCDTDDAAVATAAILATQNLYEHRPGRKSARGRCYHLVISFPPGERPATDVLRAIEDRLVDAIGYADHQRLSAVHNDTDHLHIHVAINKVHPHTLRNVEPYYDKARLMETCAALELRHGLAHTNHGFAKFRTEKGNNAAPSMAGNAAAFEAHGGAKSLTRWARENARIALLDALQVGNWQAFHSAAARYGLSAKPRGAGMVIMDEASGVAIKASAIDRALSSKALVTRLGAFQPSDSQTTPIAADHYQATPLPKHPRNSALWAAYQQQRGEALAARGTARRTQAEAHAAYVAKLRHWYREKSAHLKKRTDLSSAAKRVAWQTLFVERAADFELERKRYAAERQQASSAAPVPTWPDFLAQVAAKGDSDARAALRSRQRRAVTVAGQEVAAANPNTRTPTLAAIHSGNSGSTTPVAPNVPRKPRRSR